MHFSLLYFFCGGLGLVFLRTANVELDFSARQWEINVYCFSLTMLSLEGLFQCKENAIVQCRFIEMDLCFDVNARFRLARNYTNT